MNLKKWSDKNNEKLLLSPIYKLNYSKRKNTQEEQTSATGSVSEHSLINNKKHIMNKSLSFLNVPIAISNYLPNKIQENLKKKNLIHDNINNYYTENSNVKSSENLINFSNEKSRNNIFLQSNKNINNLKTTNNIISINSSRKNFQNQIQKLLKKHKLNIEQKKKLQFPNLLIKDNDITKKKYYFGFIDKIQDENLDNKDKKNNKNSILEKKNVPFSKKKIPSLKFNKKTKTKFTIDELLKKKFPNDNKFLLDKFKSPKKKNIKLKPVKKINLKLPQLEKVFSANNIMTKNNEITKLTNYELLNVKSERNINIQRSNFKSFEKKNTSKKNLLIKSVKFKESPICLNNIIERKKTLREEKKRKTERSSTQKKLTNRNTENNLINCYNCNLEEEFSNEYEDSFSRSDSEEKKKKKKKLKEKKKFRNRISSSTLNFSKQIIKSYEFFNFSNQEKKFLVKLYPENLIIKKLMSSNYSNILTKTKNYIIEKNQIFEKNLVEPFEYKQEMFIKSKNDMNDINEFLIQFSQRKILNYQYRNVSLNYATSFHLMNLYIPMSPQIIANFLNAKPEEKDKDCKYIFRTDKNIQKRKSVPDIQFRVIFDLMALNRENLVFYQRFIYIDHGNYENLIDIIHEKLTFEKKDHISDEEKIINNIKVKKKKIQLDILKKKFFFKMEGKQRQIMVSLFDNFIKSEDYNIQSLVENINLMTPNPSNPHLIPTLIMLFDYCIRNQSITLFLRFHHRYHNLFDINTPDIYNHNDTLLIKATKENSIGIIKYLLEKGANPNLRNEFGNTPMHYAISFKYYNIVDILKKNGAREDIENFKGLIPWECVNETCD